jgi:hypothetical protein
VKEKNRASSWGMGTEARHYEGTDNESSMPQPQVERKLTGAIWFSAVTRIAVASVQL